MSISLYNYMLCNSTWTCLFFQKKCELPNTKSKLHIVQLHKDIPRVLCTSHVFTFQFLQYCKEFYMQFKKIEEICHENTGHRSSLSDQHQNTNLASFEFQNNINNLIFINLTESVVKFWVNLVTRYVNLIKNNLYEACLP